MKDKNRVWSAFEWIAIIVWFLYWIAFAVLSIVFRGDADFYHRYGGIIPAVGIGLTVGNAVARILNKAINKSTDSSAPAAETNPSEDKKEE
ncbi:MAG: hypothetical protein J5756_04330 [Clostridia bacterium]|nr:hypothetical protein [Clostridia bacterium]